MKKIFLISLILSFTFLEANYVKVIGNGSSCRSATQVALRNAVEAVIGAKIEAKTVVANGKLDFDKVFSSTDGLVENYTEIYRSSTDEYCEVTLNVNVLDNKIEETINSYITNKSSMRMFNKSNFKDKTVMVFYTTRGMLGALETYSEAVQSIMLDIKKQLTKYQFDVRVKNQAGMSGNVDTMMKLSKMADADVILQVSLISSVNGTSDGYIKAYVRALIDMYDATTGQFISSIEGKGRSIGKNGTMGIIMAQMSASSKASSQAMPKLVKQIVSNLSVGSKKILQVSISNIPSKVKRKLRKMLRHNGIKFKTAKMQKNYVLFEFDTTDNITDFEDNFLDMWDDAGINGELEAISLQGSKLDFRWNK